MAPKLAWRPVALIVIGVVFGSLVTPAVVLATTGSRPGRVVLPRHQAILAWGSCEEGCTQSIPACGTIGGIVVDGDGFIELAQSPVTLWRGTVRAPGLSHLGDMFNPGCSSARTCRSR
jgi:hypothetical protein